MKRIIDGTTYNTDTATRLGWFTTEQENAELYVNRGGHFFLLITRSISEFEKRLGNYIDARQQALRPLTEAEAGKFAVAHNLKLAAPAPAGGEERRLTIRVPASLAAQIEAMAKAYGLSINAYAMRCLEQETAGS